MNIGLHEKFIILQHVISNSSTYVRVIWSKILLVIIITERERPKEFIDICDIDFHWRPIWHLTSDRKIKSGKDAFEEEANF